MTPAPVSHNTNYSIPTASAIIERKDGNETKILLQVRMSPPGSGRPEPEYHLTWELPQGKLEAFENVFTGLKREVMEETGLEIIKIRPDVKTQIFSPKSDESFAFQPFCCIQQTKTISGRPWIGFVFICEVAQGAEPSATEEAEQFKWFTRRELTELLKTPEKVFTYNIGALELYLNS